MSRLKIIGAIVVFFGTLAACAWFGVPNPDDGGTSGRRMLILDFMVHTVATDNFGNAGGALFYACLGILSTVLTLALKRDGDTAARLTPAEPRRTSPAEDPDPAAPPKTERRRQLAGMASLVDEPPHKPVNELASIETALNALPPIAQDGHDASVPAWGLILASPWKDATRLTSWLGGLPCAPADFEWPRDRDDGAPMHFYTQIDLAALHPEPETGRTAPCLPDNGALLVFIGAQCAVRVVPGEQMEAAEPVPPPHDLPSLRKFGYWEDGNVFPAWPVEPRAFLAEPYDEDAFWEEHDGDGRPAAFPDPHKRPADWISNWGMAALEAELTIKALSGDLRLAQESRVGSAHQHIRGYYATLTEDGPELIEALEEWKAHAASMEPTDPVDRPALERLFDRRLAFCAQVDGNFTGTIALRGARHRVWEHIRFAHRADSPFAAMQHIAPEYRPFAHDLVTDWRRHRLFGIEPPFSNNWEDLRGKACLISIGADPLLGTQTEHEYGLSLWGPVADLDAGRYDRLEIVRHCAV